MARSPASVGRSVVTVTILSDGTPLDETVPLVSVEVRRTVNRIPTAHLVIVDGDMPDQDFPLSNAETFKPGAEITIKAGYDREDAVIFKGVVVKQSIAITGDNYARMIVECRDKAVAMTIGRRNETYVDVTDSDLLTRIIQHRSGLQADVEATSTRYRELVQYYCTDWDFMLSRAEANGFLVFVEDGTVTVKSPPTEGAPVLTVAYGVDLMEFHADLDAKSQLSAVKGVGWDVKNQEVVESDEVQPYPITRQGDLDSETLAAIIGPEVFRLQIGTPRDRSALTDWARAQQIKAGLARIRGRMKFQGHAHAKPGALIELQGVGNRFTGTVFVSAVTHTIAQGNWITEVEFGLAPEWFAERRDLMAPPAAGLLPGVDGLQIGVVQQLDQDPHGEYYVKVSIPVAQSSDGVWARLATWYASQGIGAFFIPEVGDEVVLGFLNNDPSHPVILGSVYSSARQPPYELTAENMTKAIVTKGQLRIEFDDDKHVFTIRTPKGNTIVLSDDSQSIQVTDQNKNTVTLDREGITLDSAGDISMKAKGTIAIEATGTIGLTSQADVTQSGLNITHSANASYVAKGSASAELSATGQTTVKGAVVMIN